MRKFFRIMSIVVGCVTIHEVRFDSTLTCLDFNWIR